MLTIYLPYLLNNDCSVLSKLFFEKQSISYESNFDSGLKRVKKLFNLIRPIWRMSFAAVQEHVHKHGYQAAQGNAAMHYGLSPFREAGKKSSDTLV